MCEYVQAEVQRTKPGERGSGCKNQAESMCRVLEEVSALYSWDRPALDSPIKLTENLLGNAVIVITSLPRDFTELNAFMGNTESVVSIRL